MFNSSIYALQLHMNIDMNKPVLLSEASRNDKVPRSTKYQSSLFSMGTVIYICTELLCIIQSPLWAIRTLNSGVPINMVGSGFKI